MNRAGKATLPSARVITTRPDSSGWRSPCRTEGLNSASSSRNSTPLWASDISPGRGGDPPPMSPALLAEWWGLRKGRTPLKAGVGSSPATEWMSAVWNASSSLKGGRIEGSLEASIVLPEPGGPIISTPCPPAAAIWRARLAISWPAMSAKSGASADAGAGAGLPESNPPVRNDESVGAISCSTPSTRTNPLCGRPQTTSYPASRAQSA